MGAYSRCLVLALCFAAALYSPCEGCGDPNAWKQRDGRYYYVSPLKSYTHEAARRECALKGATLATITSESASNFVKGMLEQQGYTSGWIGLRSKIGPTLPSGDSLASRRQRSKWGWDMNPGEDYSQGTFDNWEGFQPKDHGCVALRGNPVSGLPYSWVATACTNQDRYICEMDQPCGTCPRGFSYIAGDCYLYMQDTKAETKQDAVDICDKYGASLLTISSAEQNARITNMLVLGRDPWLDLTKPPGHSCGFPSNTHTCFKQWTWADGTFYGFENFDRLITGYSEYQVMFEKYDTGMPLCTVLRSSDNRWFPRKCDATAWVMCQITGGYKAPGAQKQTGSAPPAVTISSILVFTGTFLMCAIQYGAI